MKTWQEVKESPNYSRLKDSLELRCARNNLLLYSVIRLQLLSNHTFLPRH